jgi:hypothetical protein
MMPGMIPEENGIHNEDTQLDIASVKIAVVKTA